MTTLSTVTNTLLTSVISELLPFGSTSLKITAGIFAGELLKNVLKLENNGYIKKWFGKKCLIIDYSDTIIFSKFEEYIVNKFFNSINKCFLIPKNGEISFKLNENTFTSCLTDNYNNHIIYIKLTANTEQTNEKQKQTYNFIIDSKTADINILKSYVQNSINLINNSKSKLLTIYKSVTEELSGKDKKFNTEWTKIYTSTTKNFKNTIVSENVFTNFYENVKEFINNEAYYAEKGIPYKKTYLLYGCPGTGKSSIIKALANEFSLDIFNIDLENMTNENISKLVLEINYRSNNKKHILVFEDIDRTRLFDDKQKYFDEKNGIVNIGNFINILDGIIEASGRIVIMTANNIDKIKSHTAFIRPGRVDKMIELSKCNDYQIKKLFKLFYPNCDLSIINNKVQNINPITPAKCIQVFQENKDDYLKCLECLCLIKEEIDNDSSINKNSRNRNKINRLSDKPKNILKDLKRKYTIINNDIERNFKRNEKIIKKYTKERTKLVNSINKLEKIENRPPAKKSKLS